jgi:hypothetical protein
MRAAYFPAVGLLAILSIGATQPQTRGGDTVMLQTQGGQVINTTPLLSSGADASEMCAQLGVEMRADASLPDGRWTRDGDCGAGAIDFRSMNFPDGAGGTCRVIGSERRQCAAIVHARCGRHNVQWQVLRPGSDRSELLIYRARASGGEGRLEMSSIRRCSIRGTL